MARRPAAAAAAVVAATVLLLLLLLLGVVVGFVPHVSSRSSIGQWRQLGAVRAIDHARSISSLNASPTSTTRKPQAQAAKKTESDGSSDARLVRVQTMDYTTLLRVGGELRRRLLPGRVENAVQPDDYRCVFKYTYICTDVRYTRPSSGPMRVGRTVGPPIYIYKYTLNHPPVPKLD